MGKSKTIGIAILAIIWIWLVWMLLAATGVNLKNLLIVVMTGITSYLCRYIKSILADNEFTQSYQ